jgi:mRNA-degrading endonuclease RelE of RelBE toxin-antitoxin system
LRVGPFRIIYAIFDRDELVLVGKIARREKDTYERREELF